MLLIISQDSDPKLDPTRSSEFTDPDLGGRLITDPPNQDPHHC